MTDLYREWQPLAHESGHYEFISLQQADGLLHVTLRREGREGARLSIQFESVVGFRCINESYRLQTLGGLEMRNRSGLMTVNDSTWMKWIREEAGGVLDEVVLQHYAIFTDLDCIDVVTEFAPEVREEPEDPRPGI